MPSQVSVPVPSPAFTLTFGGVDFRLDPNSSSDEAAQVSFTSNNDGVFVNLQSFTGTLRVVPSSSLSVPAATGVTTAAKAVANATTTSATVEEEPASPANNTTPATSNAARRPGVSPTQQQLPFAKAKPAAAIKKAIKTPDLSSLAAGASAVPVKPKKSTERAANKRALLEIQTNPVSSPMKKARESSSQESVPLGQPEEEPTQVENTQEGADTIIDCSQTSFHSSSSDNINNTQNSIIQMEESNDSFKLATDRKGQPPPCARWAHTLTKIAGNRLLCYGGQTFCEETGRPKILQDIHVYDLSKKIWYKPVNCEGVARQWHTATYLPERQLLISFGGETINPKTKRMATTDQVMVLDTEIMLWYPPTVTGAIPSGRSGHTATILPDTNELVVFGGVKGTKFQNSLAVLDTSRWKWSSPKISGDAPRPRSYHSATPVQGTNGKSQLVIFGGNGPNASFNTVHVLETDGKEWAWINPSVSGTVPLPRTGHCATLLADKKTILIYGGWDPIAEDEHGAEDEDKVFGDSYLLDTTTWKWSEGPKAVFAGDGSSVAHSLVENGGEQRVGHDCVLVEGEGGTEVLVFGGRIPNDKFTGDFQTLKV